MVEFLDQKLSLDSESDDDSVEGEKAFDQIPEEDENEEESINSTQIKKKEQLKSEQKRDSKIQTYLQKKHHSSERP